MCECDWDISVMIVLQMSYIDISVMIVLQRTFISSIFFSVYINNVISISAHINNVYFKIIMFNVTMYINNII